VPWSSGGKKGKGGAPFRAWPRLPPRPRPRQVVLKFYGCTVAPTVMVRAFEALLIALFSLSLSDPVIVFVCEVPQKYAVKSHS